MCPPLVHERHERVPLLVGECPHSILNSDSMSSRRRCFARIRSARSNDLVELVVVTHVLVSSRDLPPGAWPGCGPDGPIAAPQRHAVGPSRRGLDPCLQAGFVVPRRRASSGPLRPVTPEVAGSSPVAPVLRMPSGHAGIFSLAPVGHSPPVATSSPNAAVISALAGFGVGAFLGGRNRRADQGLRRALAAPGDGSARDHARRRGGVSGAVDRR